MNSIDYMKFLIFKNYVEKGKLIIIFFTIILEKQDNGRWTAECKELGTATFGNSIEDACHKIDKTLIGKEM